MKSSEILCVICCCLILVQNRHGYQIDFENGENRIHLESTAVRDGKIVNEPKVEEVIKTLSGFKFTNNNHNKDLNLNRDINKNLNKFENKQEIEEIVENVENSRIFITNINKNINTNDENIDDQHSQQQYQKEKMLASGHGSASIVKKPTPFSKPLKATRVIESPAARTKDLEDDNAFFARLQKQFEEKLSQTQKTQQNAEWTENLSPNPSQQAKTVEEKLTHDDSTANLTQVLPHLVQDPLWFADNEENDDNENIATDA